MFLNSNAIADELPNIQLSLTTVRNTSLPYITVTGFTIFVRTSRMFDHDGFY